MESSPTLKKILETCFLVCTWLALGLYLEIYGPTQKDLMIITSSDYEEVAVATSGRSMGLFPGCLLGGLLVDKFGGYCHLIIALCLDTAALVTAIIPWLSNINHLWACCFIGGAVESAINVAGQRRILNMWLEKSASPMILLHMGYGIGSFIVPLYSNPFLAEKMPRTEGNCTAQHFNTTTVQPVECLNVTTSDSEPIQYLKKTQIQYPYSFSAGLVALLSIVFFVYQLLYLRDRKRKIGSVEPEPENIQKVKDDSVQPDKQLTWLQQQIKMVNPATCAAGRFWYGVQIFALLFFYFANINGGERMVAGFVRSFSIDHLGFTKDEGSFVNTSFWISFTAGRFIFFVLARWISIRILIMIETGGLLATGILMNVFARDSTTAYWVLTQPLGLFVAPIWPSGVAWTDFHIELTGLGMAFILLGGSVGGFVHLRLIGYLYEHVGHVTYLYQVVGFGAVLFVFAIAMNLVGAQHGNRFMAAEKEKKEAEENNVISDKSHSEIFTTTSM